MSKTMRKNILIAFIFLVLIAIMTFPLIFHMSSYFPGFFSSDENFSPLWDSWRINYSFHNKIPLGHTPLVAYPYGWDLYNTGYSTYLRTLIFYVLSILTNPALTYNIQVITNFFLSAMITYFLVFYITKNRLGAFFSGIIFAFCPYQFMRAWQHLSLTYNELIPLALFAAILLKDKADKRTFILFLLSELLLLTFDYCIMLFGTVALGALLMYVIFFQMKQNAKFIKNVIIAGLFAVIILTPQFLSVIKNRLSLSVNTSVPSAFNSYWRPFDDLFTQSAKPLSYLLPSSMHPIFGKFTENFVGTKLYGVSFTEHTLYLGWIPLILAFMAIKIWTKTHSSKNGVVRSRAETGKNDFYIGFFLFLAIVSWLFSQPPWWKLGPVKIYMPSFFLYKILPMFRAYCRFGIVLMLAIAVLAGFGLNFILKKFNSQFTKTLIVVAFTGLVLFEFWNYPPFKVIDISKVPQVYYWLREQPGDFVIVEYPLDLSPNEFYKFYQTNHQKKIVNGSIPGTEANRIAQTSTKLSEKDTAAKLKAMGVKYILVHKDAYLKTDLIEEKEELNKIPKNPGLKLIKIFPPQDCPDKGIMCVQKTGEIQVYQTK